MLIGKPPDIPSSEITPLKDYRDYLNRRRFLKKAAAAGAAALAAGTLRLIASTRPSPTASSKPFPARSPPPASSSPAFRTLPTTTTSTSSASTKTDPARNAGALPTRPWSIKVEGKINKPQTFDIDQLLKLRPLEDRVYRHRCVEAWSMVIPWVGYSLSELIKLCDPQPSAKFVQFVSYFNWSVERWANQSQINWPYVEGLRMDEAMNPLTLLTFGLYGQVLPNQDGAPVRIVVPWKYGFKSAKSIVKIRFVEKMPDTTWNDHGAQRVWLLLQRESQRRPPALEPENGAPHRLALLRPAPHHADVQRLL